METNPKPAPRYLRRITLALVLGATILLALPFILHFFDEGSGGFGPDRLNVLALAALFTVAELHLGFLAYKFLFPRFKHYQQECLEGEGKMFENLTDELRKPLFEENNIYPDRLNQLIERRKVSQYQFTIRCVRLAFCLLVLFGLLHQVSAMLTLATLASPGVPASSLPL